MVCLRSISVDTLHKGNTDDDDDNNNSRRRHHHHHHHHRRRRHHHHHYHHHYHHYHQQQQKPLVGFDFFEIFVPIFPGFASPPLRNASTCHIFCHTVQPS
jgi:hypothetical protein